MYIETLKVFSGLDSDSLVMEFCGYNPISDNVTLNIPKRLKQHLINAEWHEVFPTIKPQKNIGIISAKQAYIGECKIISILKFDKE